MFNNVDDAGVGVRKMTLSPGITLSEQLRLPVEVIDVDGLPKVMAGGLPVTPINVALKWKSENWGTNEASLGAYVRGEALTGGVRRAP